MQIEINNVSFSYGKNEKLALDNVSFNVSKGDFLCIVGKTGSGKSTLIQMLNGLLLPDKGYIKVDDYIITSDKKLKKSLLKDRSKEIKKINKRMVGLKKKVGLVFQFPEYQVFSETILKDVMFGPINFKMKKEEAIEISKKTLSLVGLDESFYDKSPFEISGGEKRRVGIAGILASDPEILVLDEPTAGLDANGKKEIMEIVKKLNEEGKTIIVVTHDMDLVLNYASKVIVFSNSLLVEETTPLELFNKNDLSEYSLEVPSLIKLATLLKEKGFNIEIDKNLSISNLAKQIKDNIYDNR